MKWVDIARLSYLQLWFHKTRSLLCFSAVAAGVFSLVLLANIGSYASRTVTDIFDSFGLKGMTIYVKDSSNGEHLTSAFAEQIEQEIQEISTATPIKFASGAYRSGNVSGSVALVGCENDIEQSLGIQLLYGQSIPAEKIIDIDHPVVISKHFAQTLYHRDNVVGKQLYITINGSQKKYTVIGVIEDQLNFWGSIPGEYMPEIAYVPLQQLSAEKHADQILFSTSMDAESIQNAIQGLAYRSGGMHSILSVSNLSGYREQIDQLMSKMESFLLIFAVLSMSASVFAIMNGMLASMQEMRAELLLYRVIGLHRNDIFRFFLMLSGINCIIGAAIGTVLSYTLIRLVQHYLISSFYFEIKHLLTVLIVVAVISSFSGIIPARQILSSIQKELYDTK